MMTREDAIAALVERDVARWGESERAASLAMRSKLTHGRALNTLAHYDPEHVDAALAADAQRVMSGADHRALRDGAADR